jgi:hypothetical protein
MAIMGNQSNSAAGWLVPALIGASAFLVIYLVSNAPVPKKQDRHPMITEEDFRGR